MEEKVTKTSHFIHPFLNLAQTLLDLLLLVVCPESKIKDHMKVYEPSAAFVSASVLNETNCIIIIY